MAEMPLTGITSAEFNIGVFGANDVWLVQTNLCQLAYVVQVVVAVRTHGSVLKLHMLIEDDNDGIIWCVSPGRSKRQQV